MQHEWKIKKYEWNIQDLPSDNFWKHRICMNMSCSKCHCKNAKNGVVLMPWIANTDHNSEVATTG